MINLTGKSDWSVMMIIRLLLITILLTSGLEEGFAGKPDTIRLRTEVIAHRGGAGLAPENTLSAISNAISLGCEWIEIDIRQTIDSVIVVIHDATVERTTNGTGKINELTFGEIQKLDAGSWFGESFKGEKIPCLEDVMKTVVGRVKLLIELKVNGEHAPGIEKRLVSLVALYNAWDWCIFQSFDESILRAIHTLDSRIHLQKLYVGKIPGFNLYIDNKLTSKEPGSLVWADNINIYSKLASKKMIRAIHKAGKKVFIWTVNDPSEMRKLIKRGADGLMTDRPDVLMELISH